MNNIKSQSAKLGEILKRRGLSLAVAESCTGGMLGGNITAVPGSSSYFRGGIIAYNNDIKRNILGVSSDVLDRYGAVSDIVARAMASGVAKLFRCDCAMSVSGVSGPGGGTDAKPVGLVYIGVYCDGRAVSRKLVFDGNRDDIRTQSVVAAIEFLIEELHG